MNTLFSGKLSRLHVALLSFPFLFLFFIALFLYYKGALGVKGYIFIQKDTFLYLNNILGQYPSLQFNLTQLGDAFIFLSLLSVFIVYAPRIWQSVIPALLLSLLFARILKIVFAVPRPAAIFDTNSFIIIGHKLSGHNSLPSGHSITVFAVVTVLVFENMPDKFKNQIIWLVSMFIIGLMVAFTRVGVGAHYPVDVLVGCNIGYIAGISGVFIGRKVMLCRWVYNKRYYPFFILMFLVSGIVMVLKILNENLIIYYLSLFNLAVSLFTIISVYAKKYYEVNVAKTT